MGNDMSGVYASTRSGGVSPILGVGIFLLVIPFIVNAININLPLMGLMKWMAGIIIVIGLLHQVVMTLGGR